MKKIFIVPYRDRAPHKSIFLNHMKELLKTEKDYEILFCHQCDKRNFNRGGMRNIGFLYAKKTYKNWKDITFIFHDIDYLPYIKLFNYETTKGTVTHFYGLKFALGGIWAIKGCDFDNIKGFPNFWAWGFEDNKIKCDWLKYGGKINYDQFINYDDTRIVKLDCSNHGHDKRKINSYNLFYASNESYEKSGFHTIRDLEYDIENIEKNIKMINVRNFLTEKNESVQKYVKDVTSADISIDHKRRIKRAQPPPTPGRKPTMPLLGLRGIAPRKFPVQIQMRKKKTVTNIVAKSRKSFSLEFGHYRFKKK